MEKRAQKYQRARRSEALREEIASLVEGELEDPRIGLVTVNQVQLAPDGKVARVFIAVTGSDQELGGAERIARLYPPCTYNEPRPATCSRPRIRARPIGAAWQPG